MEGVSVRGFIRKSHQYRVEFTVVPAFASNEHGHHEMAEPDAIIRCVQLFTATRPDLTEIT